MAVLASATDVKNIMNDQSLDSTYVTTILNTVDAILSKVYEYDNTLTDALLTELQKYYAAHIIASTTKRIASEEKVGDASIKYTGEYKSGLNSTPYGQMVLMIDPTGLVARAGKISASITAIKSFE